MVDLTKETFFHTILVWPIVNLLFGVYKGFSILSIPGALGLSIISLTLLIRGALHPLTHKQMESARKIQELKPQIDKLQKKYEKDKQKLQMEQMKLYQEHGVNPAAGCLPLLIQLPIIFGLFQAFRGILLDESIEHATSAINQIVYFDWLKVDMIDLSFFGINLGLFPNMWQEQGIWLLLIPVVTGALTYYQTKMMSAQATPLPEKAPKKKKGDDEKKPEDMMADMQKQMMYIMPVMIGIFSYNFPLGIALYWNTYTIFAIATHDHFKKPHGK